MDGSGPRQPLPPPALRLTRRPASIFDYTFDDIEIVGYQSHPAIKRPGGAVRDADRHAGRGGRRGRRHRP
ncbi:MAG: thymidylate synthase [Vicinamibacterales bacterium]